MHLQVRIRNFFSKELLTLNNSIIKIIFDFKITGKRHLLMNVTKSGIIVNVHHF